MLEADLKSIQNQITSLPNNLITFCKSIAEKDKNIGSEIYDIVDGEMDKLSALNDSATNYLNNPFEAAVCLFEITEIIDNVVLNLNDRLEPYISYPQRRAQRKNELKEFVSAQMYGFTTTVMDEISRFMDNKKATMYAEIQNNLSKTEMAKDTFIKPIGKLISKTGLIKEPKTFIEQLVQNELGPSSLGTALINIIEKAGVKLETAWHDKIISEVPETKGLEDAVAIIQKTDYRMVDSADNPASLAAGTGMILAGAGTLGLAAGWHTLAYSMANVFPPIFLATVAFSTIVFFSSEKGVKEKTKLNVDKFMNYCYGYVITNIFKTPVDSFEKRNLPSEIEFRANKRIVKVLDLIEKQFAGNLTNKDFEQLKIEITGFNKSVTALKTQIKTTINDLKEFKSIQKPAEKMTTHEEINQESISPKKISKLSLWDKIRQIFKFRKG